MNGTSNIFEIRENFIFPGEREIFETKMNNDFAPTNFSFPSETEGPPPLKKNWR